MCWDRATNCDRKYLSKSKQHFEAKQIEERNCERKRKGDFVERFCKRGTWESDALRFKVYWKAVANTDDNHELHKSQGTFFAEWNEPRRRLLERVRELQNRRARFTLLLGRWRTWRTSAAGNDDASAEVNERKRREWSAELLSRVIDTSHKHEQENSVRLSRFHSLTVDKSFFFFPQRD